QKTSRSDLRATLRLDPCIALWVGNNTILWDGVTIRGDVSCNGTLSNSGAIEGDAFTGTFSGNNPTGQLQPIANLPLAWPRITVVDFTSNYAVQTITNSVLSGLTLGPYDPVRVCFRNGDLVIAGNTHVEGMLIVNGNLTVRNGINTITAGKNLPAMLVTGNLIVESGGELEIEGLAVIDGDMQVSAGAAGVNLLGGLFIQGTLVETTADSSGNGNNGTIFGATQTVAGTGFALHFDGADDYVRIAVDPALDNLDAITMMARIYPRVDSHWHVLDKGDGDKRIFSEGLNRTLDGRVRYTSVNAWSESAGGTIELNTWQYVALTWSPSTNSIRLFRDGIEVQYGYQAIGSGAALDDTTHPFTIGVRSGLNNGTFFDGLINDVRLYDRALDPNEIYPPNDSLPGLIGHWKLDESGSSVTITAAPSRTAIVTWSAAGVVEKWGQAAGAFFKSIERK
ncbi:MAG: LamG domain-containing protein, partial [Phycisphaerales bacterium]